MKDVYTMVHGWSNKMDFTQRVVRRHTEIMAEVVNRSAGGQGVGDFVIKSWPMKGDATHRGIDPKNISLILAAHKEAREKNARRVKNNSRG